jgi:phage-related minor tail protein
MDLTLGLIADVARFHTGMASAEHDVEAFAGKTTEAENKSGSFFNGMLGAAATGGVAAIGAGLLAVGGNALDMAGQVRQGAADAQAALGLTQGQAQDLANTAVTIFGQNWGDSVADVNSTLITVRQQMKGLADSDLPGVAEGALALRDTFGIDVAESTNAANTLMSKFGLTSKQAFDFIAAGNQKGLNASGDFLDTIGEYSTQFAAGGASADQFFSLLQYGMQGGVLGTDKAADAFKEFRVRIQDGSKTTSAALTAIGIDQEKLLQGMETGAISAADAFTMVQDHLNATTDTTVRMQAGVGLLGTQFEDLGTQGALALSLTGTKMGDLAGATDSLNAKYTTLPSLLEGGMRQFQTAILPVSDLLLQIGNQALPIVSAAIGTLAGWLTGAITSGMNLFNTGLAGAQSLMTTLADPINIIIGYVTTLKGNFDTFFNTVQSGGDIFTAFGALLSSNFAAISTAAGDLIGWIANTGLPMFVQALGDWATAFVSWIAPLIPPMLGELANMLGNLVGWLVGTALPAIIGKLAEWGSAFVAWIGPQIPPMLAQLSVLAGQLWDWMTGTALPNIMQKLGQWGAEFVAWIGPQIPPMLGALAGLLASLAGWLLGTALPTIIGKLLEWGLALVAWIAPRIPELIGALGGLLASLGGWLVGTALPAIIQQLAQWGQAFLDWVGTSVLPNIGAELGKIALALYGWITQTRDAILGKAGEIGANLVAGIRDGVAGAWQGFLNWVGSLAAGLPDPIKQALGIHSPADETQPVGSFFIQGIQVGAESAVPALLGTLQGIAQSMIDWGANLLTTAQAIFAPMPDVFTGAANAIYAAWLPTFGPGGTIDLLMFAHDESAFFARLDATTNSRMDGYAITWSNKLIILNQRITDGLTDIRNTAVNAGVGIAQGLGEGFTGAIEDVGRAMANAAIAAVNSAIDAAANAVGGANIPGASAASGGTGPNSMMHAPGSAAAPTMASARPIVQVFIDNGNGYEPADASNVRYVLQEAQYQVTAASRAGVGSLGGRL